MTQFSECYCFIVSTLNLTWLGLSSRSRKSQVKIRYCVDDVLVLGSFLVLLKHNLNRVDWIHYDLLFLGVDIMSV